MLAWRPRLPGQPHQSGNGVEVVIAGHHGLFVLQRQGIIQTLPLQGPVGRGSPGPETARNRGADYRRSAVCADT
jgi:hypothetical protein